jgi:hypothetical protein
MNLHSRCVTALTVLLAGGLLAACGSDAESAPDEAEYVEAVASAWEHTKDTKVSDAQARCWGQKMVNKLGINRVSSVGTPVEFGRRTVDLDLKELNLNKTDAQEIYDDFLSCGGNLSHDTDKILGELGLSDSMNDCVADSLDGEVMKNFFVVSVQEGNDAAAASLSEDEGLQEALTTCVVNDPELADSMG